MDGDRNELWLTDVTEFHAGSRKVYLPFDY